MKKTIVALFALYPALVVPVQGVQLNRFMPRLFYSHAELVTQFSYESSKDSVEQKGVSDLRDNKKRTRKLRESLNYDAIGYVYHPDLFVFLLNGSVFLQQQRRHSGDLLTKGDSDDVVYGFEGELFRRKSYNAKMYHRVEKPFVTGDTLEASDVETFYSGLEIKYEDEKLRTYARFDSTEREDSRDWEDDDNYELSLFYSDRKFSQHIDNFRFSTGVYRRIEKSRDKTDIHDIHTDKKTTDRLFASQSMRFKEKVKSTTTASVSVEERNLSDNNKLKLSEKLGITLPWSLTMGMTLQHDKSVTTPKQSSLGEVENEIDTFDFALRQDLYKSLRSRVTANYVDNRSSQGSFKSLRYGAGSRYTKKTRGGGISSFLYNTTYMTERSGRIYVNDELVTNIALGDRFVLDKLDADPATIFIEAEITNSSGNTSWYPLTACEDTVCTAAGEDWSILSSAGSQVEIVIEDGFKLLSVFDPGGGGNPNYNTPDLVGDQFTFRVSYYTQAADYIVKTNVTNFHLGMGVIEDLLSWEFTHEYTVQKLEEGDPDIIDLDPEIMEDELSVFLIKEPFTFSAAYRIIDSDYEEKKWTVIGDCRKNFKLQESIQSTAILHYDRSEAEIEREGGATGKSKEYLLSGGIYSSTNIPMRIPVHLYHEMGYSKNVGNIPKFQRNSLGFYSTSTTVEKDSDKYFTTIGFDTKTSILLPKLILRVRGRHSYENDTIGERRKYSVLNTSTGYRWEFGATFLSLNCSYEWDKEDTKEENSWTVETGREAKIFFNITRQLF